MALRTGSVDTNNHLGSGEPESDLVLVRALSKCLCAEQWAAAREASRRVSLQAAPVCP
jgi:hypothetical protein